MLLNKGTENGNILSLQFSTFYHSSLSRTVFILFTTAFNFQQRVKSVKYTFLYLETTSCFVSKVNNISLLFLSRWNLVKVKLIALDNQVYNL